MDAHDVLVDLDGIDQRAQIGLRNGTAPSVMFERMSCRSGRACRLSLPQVSRPTQPAPQERLTRMRASSGFDFGGGSPQFQCMTIARAQHQHFRVCPIAGH